MNPPTPIPINSSASSTLTTAMIHSAMFVDCKSPISLPLRRPAALWRGAGHVAQRTPPFVRGGAGLLDGTAHPRQLAHEIVQSRLDLVTNAAAAFRHVQPAPHTSDDSADTGRHQYSRSLVHVRLLHGRSRGTAHLPRLDRYQTLCH